MTAYALTAVALAAGYVLGRWRPAHRASDWAWWLTYRARPVTRREWRWWAAQLVFAAELGRELLLHPRATVRGIRRRNDPTPPRGPALQFRDRADDRSAP